MGELSGKELCALIRECAKSHVQKLTLGGLSVEFAPSTTESPQVSKQNDLAPIILDTKEEEFSDLLLSDPLKFESSQFTDEVAEGG